MSTPNEALTRRQADPPSQITRSTGGVLNTVEEAARAIKSLGEKHNLIVPGGAIGSVMPQLYAAGVSFVFVDLKHETYKIYGKDELGIGKNALDRIAAAAGVRWIPGFCGRVDDGSDPAFVEYQVSGVVLQLDGTERTISAVKRIDLRAQRGTDPEAWGSDAAEIARQAAAAKPNPRDPWPQILAARQHILSLAESKAKNRAIRSLGVRTAYTATDIEKGFAVVRLQFTGHHDDPEVEREISLMVGRRALSSSAMLYGGQQGQTQARLAQPPRTVQRLVTAPEAEADDDVIDTTAAPHTPAEPQPKPATEGQSATRNAGSAEQAPAAPPADRPAAPAGPRKPEHDPMMVVGKKDKDGIFPRKPASELSVDHLTSLIEYHEGKKKAGWDPRWADKNQLDLDALYEWRAYKSYDPSQPGLPMDEYGDEQGQGDGEIPF